ncbi:MAG: phosphatase PAP2 family protein [Kiritimatiellales bacterium]
MPTTLFTRTRNITFILLAAVAVVCPIFYFAVDLPAAKFVHTKMPSAIHHLAAQITGAGDWFLYLFAIIALIARLIFKNKLVFRQFLFPLLAAAAAGIITTILKLLVGRWRPKEFFRDGLYGFSPFHNAASWPSGHSAGIMAMMTAIAIFFPKWRAPCFVIATLVGSTRIVLTEHYPGDVLAGLVLGYLCAHWLYCLLVRCKQLPEQES